MDREESREDGSVHLCALVGSTSEEVLHRGKRGRTGASAKGQQCSSPPPSRAQSVPAHLGMAAASCTTVCTSQMQAMLYSRAVRPRYAAHLGMAAVPRAPAGAACRRSRAPLRRLARRPETGGKGGQEEKGEEERVEEGGAAGWSRRKRPGWRNPLPPKWLLHAARRPTPVLLPQLRLHRRHGGNGSRPGRLSSHGVCRIESCDKQGHTAGHPAALHWLYLVIDDLFVPLVPQKLPVESVLILLELSQGLV